MAITAQGIENAIQVELNKLGAGDLYNSLLVHSAWANGLRNYLKSNLTVTGDYVGETNTTPPVVDSLGGSYVWGVETFVLTGSSLLDLIQGLTLTGFSAWVQGIEEAIKGITIKELDTTKNITLDEVTPFEDFVFNLVQGDLSAVTEAGGGLTIIAQKLYSSLVGLDVTELEVLATSKTPGTGVVTYSEVT